MKLWLAAQQKTRASDSALPNHYHSIRFRYARTP